MTADTTDFDSGADARDGTDQDAMPPAAVAGHVHLKVADLAVAERFYRAVLGVEVTERVGEGFVFLSFGDRHHDIALQERSGAAPASPADLGMYHFAFELPDERALRAAAERLVGLGVDVVPADHGISKALYFADPDGNGVELYVDRRDRRASWGGVDDPVGPGFFDAPNALRSDDGRTDR